MRSLPPRYEQAVHFNQFVDQTTIQSSPSTTTSSSTMLRSTSIKDGRFPFKASPKSSSLSLWDDLGREPINCAIELWDAKGFAMRLSLDEGPVRRG